MILIFRLALLAGLAVVIVGSLLPGGSVSGVAVSDKIQHLAGYAFLGFTAQPALGRQLSSLGIGIGLGLLGVALELAQALVPGRSSDPIDIAANLAGVAAGLLAGWRLRPAAP